MTNTRTTTTLSEDEESTFTAQEVREATNEKDLEEARPIQGTSQNTGNILSETGVSGGSDNTAVPAYGNASHVTPKEHMHRVEDAPAAQEEYQGEDSEGATTASKS